jgi:hypothetical protein
LPDLPNRQKLSDRRESRRVAAAAAEAVAVGAVAPFVRRRRKRRRARRPKLLAKGQRKFPTNWDHAGMSGHMGAVVAPDPCFSVAWRRYASYLDKSVLTPRSIELGSFKTEKRRMSCVIVSKLTRLRMNFHPIEGRLIYLLNRYARIRSYAELREQGWYLLRRLNSKIRHCVPLLGPTRLCRGKSVLKKDVEPPEKALRSSFMRRGSIGSSLCSSDYSME